MRCSHHERSDISGRCVIDTTEARRLLYDALAVRTDSADRALIDTALAAITRLMSVLESQRTVCAGALRAITDLPSAAVAQASGIDRRDADVTLDRAEVVRRAPQLGAAHANGSVSGKHLDRFSGAYRRMKPADQAALLERIDDIVDVAKSSTPEEFAAHLRQVEREFATDDGETAFTRQQRNVRLRTWVGADDGMHYFQLVTDTETAMSIDSRIRAATEALFHGHVQFPLAPIDVRERNSYIAAQALIGLITAKGGARLGRPEYIIVEDRRVPEGCSPVVDLGTPGTLPPNVVAELRSTCRQFTVVTEPADGSDRVVQAPGNLRLGRAARLANGDQRRALRAMYARCAVADCPVRFDDCTIHHVHWWRNGGVTDIDNLVPLCWRHHAAVHQGTELDAIPNRRARPP